ncbi:MAG: hypothetical protein II812_05030, partial [Prevotella sp.]|nr:hypothetical protein [Prevotella sp.]
MKNVFKKISMMLVGAAFVLPSQAQLLKVTVKDKALQKQAMFINHGEFLNMEFDETGVWTYNNTEKVKAPTEVNMMLGSAGFIPALVEPGKTISVEVLMKNDKPQAKYKGDNVAESRFLFEEGKFTPERMAPRSFDPEDFEDLSEEEINEHKTYLEKQRRDTITFDEAYRRLDQHYAATKKAANAVKDADRRADYLHRTEVRSLSNLLDLTETRAHAWKMDLKKDVLYQQLLSRINPNDELGVD